MELPDRREAARGGTGLEAARFQPREIGPDGAGIGTGERAAIRRHGGGIILQLAAIGGQRVQGRATFGRLHVEKALDEPVVAHGGVALMAAGRNSPAAPRR